MVLLLYSLAGLNAALYAGYFMLWLFGFVGYPSGWTDGAIMFGLGCLVMPLLPVFGLTMRYKFDLLRMADGTSFPSRVIWSVLSAGLTLLLLYGFILEFILQ